ncbi:MAG: hypothetical protein JNM39_15825 [Bdellovibrionaceae bacterium]|nr:hypothetical protein [Pseudobdellovibrionaceae bacterium]
MYIDTYGIIVQKDFDGGDSLHREGMYHFGKTIRFSALKNEIFIEDVEASRQPASANDETGEILEDGRLEKNIIDKFEVSPGIYVRHPDPKKWYSNPDTTSRDQLLPVIAYCAAKKDYPRLWRLFKASLFRGFFAQNLLRIGEGETEKKVPDPMHLNLAQFIRAGGWWTAPFYHLLLVFDSIELVGTLLGTLPLHFRDDHWIPRWRNQNDVDDNNIVVQHLLAALYKPTPISELNRYLYSVTRAENFGNTKLGEKNPVMGALRWYHRSEYGGEANPEIAEIYRPLIQKYFTYPTIRQLLSDFLISIRNAPERLTLTPSSD